MLHILYRIISYSLQNIFLFSKEYTSYSGKNIKPVARGMMSL